MQAAEARLHDAGWLACPHCDQRVEKDFLRCPNCLRKLKDADGRFLWSDGMVAGEPARLMGYKVLICEDMPDIAANSLSIAFGDFQAGYTIAKRPDLRVLRDDDEPFNGLYACGDVAGSFYGHEYPLHLPGGSIGRGFVFGILSVKAMCGDLESTVE